MKATDQAHAELVRMIIAVLEESELTEDTSPAFGAFNRVAADIVGQISGIPMLFFDGEIWPVSGQVWRLSEKSDAVTTVWQVPTLAANGPLCRWCNEPYGTKDPGARHSLCKRCYENGPPQE